MNAWRYKEDIEKERLGRGQGIISEYYKEKGLTEARQVMKDPVYLEEIIKSLLNKSKLSHRQISSLLRISNSIVHRISLEKD